MFKTSFITLSIFVLVSVAGRLGAEPDSAIFYIGDGMGPAQVTAARIYQANARDGKLALDTFDQVAIVRTYAKDRLVADSAAAGTALATGVKVNVGVISEAEDGTPIETVLEKAKKAGKSVGLVTTTTITHATPACFFAHAGSRANERALAEQLVAYGQVDVVLGGGRRYFQVGEGGGEDLIAKAKAGGYRYLQNKGEFDALAAEVASGKEPGKILGLFSNGMMSYEIERNNGPDGEPSLAEMSALAIKILSRNPKGYFLMVEGGRIDHACHDNRAHAALGDLLAFDAAIQLGLDHLKERPNTFIVVTADHETGGLSINGYPEIAIGKESLFAAQSMPGQGDILTFATGPGFKRDGMDAMSKIDPSYRQPALRMASSAAHTGVDVHAWAAGDGAEQIRGTMDNTEVGAAVIRLLGLQ